MYFYLRAYEKIYDLARRVKIIERQLHKNISKKCHITEQVYWFRVCVSAIMMIMQDPINRLPRYESIKRCLSLTHLIESQQY